MTNSSLGRILLSGGLAVFALIQTPRSAQAQSFGQNKVIFNTFKCQVLQTQHFDIYCYEDARQVTHMARRIAER